MVTIVWWALVFAPMSTLLIGIMFGYYLHAQSEKHLQWLLDNVVGDTIYNVSGDYIERPFDESEMSKIFTASSDDVM